LPSGLIKFLFELGLFPLNGLAATGQLWSIIGQPKMQIGRLSVSRACMNPSLLSIRTLEPWWCGKKLEKVQAEPNTKGILGKVATKWTPRFIEIGQCENLQEFANRHA
jgi:hypothetical protein